MNERYYKKNKSYNIERLCKTHNVSSQAYYKNNKKLLKRESIEEKVLLLIHEIRKLMPKFGIKKIYEAYKEKFRKLKVGRDKLFDIARKFALLVKRKRRFVKTTDSSHGFRVYPNIVKGMTASSPNEVFVSDITYIPLKESYCYLALITDVYSRKIVGYNLSLSLAVSGSMQALRMALNKVTEPKKLIHHSDRGIQYSSKLYVEKLKKKKIKISMSAKGNPYENAIAERVNGILKDEFYLNVKFTGFKQALKAVKQSINIYNSKRLHWSLGLKTPDEIYAA
ncbi:MAG: IS3 family transposase, partial [Calditrichia bacterium]|nr:IS3 family transposase [Calditrichia bacterium]